MGMYDHHREPPMDPRDDFEGYFQRMEDELGEPEPTENYCLYCAEPCGGRDYCCEECEVSDVEAENDEEDEDQFLLDTIGGFFEEDDCE